MSDPFTALGADPDPDTLEANAKLEAEILAQPPTYELSPAAARQRHDDKARQTRPRFEEAWDGSIETEAGALRARFFIPRTVRSVYLYIHGGMWMVGDIDLADGLLAPRAARGHTAVVSLGYRLVPEHPWRAALEDCTAAALWLAEHARERFGADRLVIGGDSAGAHLAVATLLSLRDGGLSPFSGADLRYGMYDMRLTPSARLHRGPVFDARTLNWVLDHVFDPQEREDPLVSPLLADLRGLPPALFTVGTGDSLLDDSVFMWSRWRASGNQAELSLHPGALHGFDYMGTSAGDRALDRSVAFIQACSA